MRSASLIALFLFIGVSFALPAQASFLPDCDQTVYNVSQKAPDVELVDYKMTPQQFEDKYPPNMRDSLAVEILVNRPCGIDDFVQLFINLANWGLSILAIIATLMYIWGGFTFLIAGGRDEYIKEGKDIMIGTSTGIIVVITAYLIVTFWSFASLGQEHAFATDSGFSRSIFGQSLSCLSSYTEECKVDQATLQTNFHQGCGDKKTKDVATIQKKLVEKKCLAADRITGCFDSVTRDAVIKFQIISANMEEIKQTMAAQSVQETVIQGSVDYYTHQVLLGSSATDCT